MVNMSEENRVKVQASPVIIPADLNKHIEEHFGLLSTGDADISIARMVAPPGWDEPAQQPEFDEYVLMVRGKQSVTVDGSEYVISAGESMRIGKNCRVRYANPFDETAEYWSICIPAFSLETVHRDVGDK
jgi:mannose-6-phosphate isomerase-like protein (cupin superfamily)